jgi:hypothetical protein
VKSWHTSVVFSCLLRYPILTKLPLGKTVLNRLLPELLISAEIHPPPKTQNPFGPLLKVDISKHLKFSLLFE